MKIQAGEISLYLEIDESRLNKGLIPLLFLHGFTGSSAEWKFIFDKLGPKVFPIAADLIGHGNSDSPTDTSLYSAEAISKQIDFISASLNLSKLLICGYSMGGRAALSYYSKYPHKILGLILESTTPGIKEEPLRIDRIKSDDLLAQKIEKEGASEFGNYWLNLPMFENLKTLPQEEYLTVLKSKACNNPVGLINSLKGFGTGSMPELWNNIRAINFPTLLISGEYDSKFTGINEQMKKNIINSEHVIIKNCGHNAHLEKPEEFINLVNKYLSDNFLPDIT